MPWVLLYLLAQHRAKTAAPSSPKVARLSRPVGKVVHGQVVEPAGSSAMNPQSLLHLWLLFKGLG